MGHDRHPTIIGNDSGYAEQPSRNIILRHNSSEQEIRSKRTGMNNFLQQEQHLANCVRLIAADMEEFEKEPETRISTHHVPNPIPFINMNTHTTMIPNSEIFKGTCADEAFPQNHAPIVKFPSQPLDLSTLSSSAASLSPPPSTSSEILQRRLHSPPEKGKRKRVRKQTEPLPMTPMPLMSKDDDGVEDNDPSTDSGISLNSEGSKRILVAPKKRKRVYQQNDQSSLGSA